MQRNRRHGNHNNNGNSSRRENTSNRRNPNHNNIVGRNRNQNSTVNIAINNNNKTGKMLTDRNHMQYIIGERELKQMIYNYGNKPNELLLALKREKSFLQLITDESRLKGRFDDYSVLCRIIHIFGIICDSESAILLPFITRICDSNFYQPIQNYMMRFPALVKPLSSRNSNIHTAAFCNLVKFVRQMQIMIPQSSRDKIKLIQLSLTDALEICNKKCDVIRQSTVDLLKLIKTQSENALKNSNLDDEKAAKAEKMHAILQPPDNFRDLSIAPTYDDIHVNGTPFLRSNLINGKYFDVDHYLDVQFRLLREDYVRPLREGIAQYLNAIKENDKKKVTKLKDIRVYSNVRIIGFQLKDGIIYDIQFDVSHLKNVQWMISDRLMHGSLLCLSYDNFQTFYFATVTAPRIVEKLEKGIVSIKLETQSMNEEFNKINSQLSLTMVESQAYFEAYRHNLQTLQTFNSENFPLQDYIINVSNTIENLPYLKQTTAYDLTDLASNLIKIDSDDKNAAHICAFKQKYNINSTKARLLKSVCIMESSSWPHINILGFDDSQYNAFKAALTKQMVIIQGPPGTGKTYIGLRIVQTLLRNSKHWNGRRNDIVNRKNRLIDENLFQQSNHKPILIVCYTNHALDQFLEGIVPYCNVNRGIVRLGGRSKSEILQSYTLMEIKRKVKANKVIPESLYKSLKSSRDELNEIQTHLLRLQNNIFKYNRKLLNESELIGLSRKHVWIALLMKYLRQITHDINLALVYWLTEQSNWNGFDEDVDYNYNAKTIVVENDDDIDIDVDEDEVRKKIDARIIDNDDYYYYENAKEVNNNKEEKTEECEDSFTKKLSKKERKMFMRLIKHELKTDAMTDDEINRMFNRTKNIWHFNHKHRWRIYRRCVDICCDYIEKEVVILRQRYINEYRSNQRLRLEEDLCVIRGCDVIGMTTTGAAKYRSIVEKIDPLIVVIEEAAEVLESHVITSLTKSTNHLILIGDHQQLKPNPNVYELAKKYNLDVSLFERMIKNGMPFHQLKLQHRMRPNISSLLVPHFYKELRDHSSVNQYEDIKGMSKNMYFLNHNEMESYYNESQSKFNEFEANFVVYLCKYLIQQQYKPTQITIIVMYSAQLFKVKNIMKAHHNILDGVRVTVVDNYQGEENDIIILSFVRSNIEGTIGFLQVSNRVNVALSRAKMGLYGIGNFDCLAERSDLWKNINKDLAEQQAIGTHLEIYCQNHPTTKTLISKANDFLHVPEGGCTKPCEYRLDCGHVCPKTCHVYDHETVKCPKICNNSYDECDHLCSDICHFPESCEPCKIKVIKTMPLCGHKMSMKCSSDPLTVKCLNKCEKVFICGHKCTSLCGFDCNPFACNENVQQLSQCEHVVNIACCQRNNAEKLLSICTEDCGTVLKCGHKCGGSCGLCQQNRLHVKCQMKCERVLVCGHICKAVCGDNCPPCREKCKNRCYHSRCGQLCGEPCPPCLERCNWKCKHQKCTRNCSEKCDLEPCVEPCDKKLKCGHLCIGICGQNCPKKCRICNKEEVDYFGNDDEWNARYIQLEDCQHVLELNGMIEWLSKSEDNDSEDAMRRNTSVIQMKSCPRCKTIIRRTKLFNTPIQQSLRDIELVKIKLFGNVDEIERTLNSIYVEILMFFEVNIKTIYSKNKLILEKKMQHLINAVKSNSRKSKIELYIIETKFEIIKQLTLISDQLWKYKFKRKLNTDFNDINILIGNIYRRIDKFMKFIDSLVNNDQQIHDLRNEFKFIRFSSEITKVLCETVYSNEEAKSNLVEAFKILSGLGPLSDENKSEIKALISKANQLEGGSGVSIQEYDIIVKSMDFCSGHWYKCSNGHVYCIGECGGDIQQIKCMECYEYEFEIDCQRWLNDHK